jgi:general secretion pathway protein E
MLSFSFARKNQILAEQNNEGWAISYSGEFNLSIFTEAQRSLGIITDIHFLESDSFDQKLQTLYSGQTEGLGELNASLDDSVDLDELIHQLDEPEDLLESDEDAPIIRLLNALFSEAIRANASDIHVESYESRNRVRFRVDGVMKEMMTLQKHIAPLLISRIKVMSKLDIAEKRIPQDGRIALRLGGRSVDLRVSTLPSAQGERVVMRLLDKQAGRLNLDNLGLPKKNAELVHKLINSPYGIILVTGPTGSGKTTSLYATLTQLNDNKRNIMTVEDPIEYNIDGINQTQINEKIDMTFARGIRAILRQDPDVVMVGEIRDTETAQISVQASLTGHLVLSTLHTNTAVGAITRLRDMGIESFLIASSLIGVIAQRLTRRLCKHCREPYTPSEEQKKVMEIPAEENVYFYKAVGCEECSKTGYSGRIGLYELLMIDDTVRQYIHENASEQKVTDYARQHTLSLQQEAVTHLLDGTTSFEEVVRVIHNL